MTPKGNHITIRAEPLEKVTKSGIIIPDTATKPNQQWGVVVDGNGLLNDGCRVLFMGNKCFSTKVGDKDLKLVNLRKLLYWYEE